MMNATRRQTPSQTVGPFFHDTLVSEGGNILVEDATRGERIRIFGSVLDGDGVPVPDALLELWQPDARGLYPHTSDPRAEEADEAFCGFGRAATDDDGLYWFETIKPGGPAPEAGAGQAPFVSVRVFARGLLIHAVTRIYFEDETNDADPVLSRLDPEGRTSLLARREEGGPHAHYRFDVILQGPNETVFFDV